MAWIETVPYQESKGRLRTLYDRIKGPDGAIDNIMASHSLRPHSMEGHMALYKNVLHHTGNSTPKSFLETIGVWVSLLNQCDYCVEHHFSGLQRLLDEPDRGNAIRAAFESRDLPAGPFSPKELAALIYAQALTQDPGAMSQKMIADLRDAGWTDGEILEINQVTAYFCYANRTVLGLGCSLDGDVLGLSPGNSEDPSDWGHG